MTSSAIIVVKVERCEAAGIGAKSSKFLFVAFIHSFIPSLSDLDLLDLRFIARYSVKAFS
jgi:hypothetical protein